LRTACNARSGRPPKSESTADGIPLPAPGSRPQPQTPGASQPANDTEQVQ
jgi:hypothetical protein